MSDLQITIVNKSFPSVAQAQSHHAIAMLDLSFQAGEFVCLVGPSGCGKTTLLNIIAGLDTDFQGDIRLNQPHKTPRIGYIFQNPRLLPWRTVRENIELALPENQSTEIVDSLLAAMNLTEMAHVYPERLSLGMSRRVALIRAFAIDPDILLMDEPFVSLDPPTARQVRSLLVDLWQKRPHTVLFVTHDLREAIAMADKLIFLSKPPMTVVSEVVVEIPRNKRNNEQEIDLFRQQLFSGYPEIKALL